MLSWLSDRSRTRDMIISTCWSHEHVTNMLMLSCLVYDFCRKVTTACDQHVNIIMSILTCWSHAVVTFRQKSYTRDMITLTCWSQAVVTFRQKSYTRHDNINMLVTCRRDFPTEVVLSCVVCDFCWKVMTACDQHVNVIMCRVRLLSESVGSMWTTCWYYQVSRKTSVGKSRQQ
jgi:hypothetical protein